MLVKYYRNLASQSGTFPSGAAALMMSRVAEQRGNVHAAASALCELADRQTLHKFKVEALSMKQLKR